MSIELQDLSKTTPFDRLLCLLCGLEKSGKSRLAATGRKPILFFDFDGRAASLSGREGLYAVTLREPGWPKQPTAFNDFLDVLTKLESGYDLEAVGFRRARGVRPRTIVLDSIATMAKAAMNYALYTNSDVARSIKFSGLEVKFPKSFDAWNAEMSTIESAVLRVMGIGGASYQEDVVCPECGTPTGETCFHKSKGRLDVIATLHQTEQESPESKPENKIYTGKLDVFPARYRLLVKYFNEVWRVEQMQTTVGTGNDQHTTYRPKVFTRPTYRFEYAATCLEIDDVESPSIEDMINRHIARIRESKGLLLTQGAPQVAVAQ